MLKKRLLWIGCLESDKEFQVKSQKGYNLSSAQVSQQNILNGIEEVTGLIFDSINGSVLPPYPIYKDRVIEEVTWSHKENASNISVGYKNNKYINRLSCQRAMVKAAKRWVESSYKNEELIVFVYSMRSSVMATAIEIKKLIPNAKLFLIVTDLPQFMDLGQNKLKAFLKRLDWIQIKRMQQQFDGFILYASKMAEYLKIPDGKWMLMEGSFDVNDIPTHKKKESKKRVLMYSGMIEKRYGLELLIEVFKSIEIPDLELWITGGGKDSEYVINQAKNDCRIKFYGFLPSRKDVLLKQQEATALINMRLPSENASAYCFPSKLFEYMASGTPVLSFNLEGIPDEYDKHLILIESEEELRDSILSILKMPLEQRVSFGLNAREFIKENKNNIYQSGRIVRFCKGILGGE